MREYAGIILTFPYQLYAFQDVDLNINMTLSLPSLFADLAIFDEKITILNHGLIGAILPATSAPFSGDTGSVELQPADRILNDISIQYLCQILYPGTMDGRYYHDRSRYTKLVKLMINRLSSR